MQLDVGEQLGPQIKVDVVTYLEPELNAGLANIS